jgi:hypothetical protein
MRYLKEMNEIETGYEVISYDKDLVEYTDVYETYDEALDFISTLDLIGIV